MAGTPRNGWHQTVMLMLAMHWPLWKFTYVTLRYVEDNQLLSQYSILKFSKRVSQSLHHSLLAAQEPGEHGGQDYPDGTFGISEEWPNKAPDDS